MATAPTYAANLRGEVPFTFNGSPAVLRFGIMAMDELERRLGRSFLEWLEERMGKRDAAGNVITEPRFAKLSELALLIWGGLHFAGWRDPKTGRIPTFEEVGEVLIAEHAIGNQTRLVVTALMAVANGGKAAEDSVGG